ncbi:MAG: nitrile hydratase subunit beta [Gammaproteobacteria bacterium]|nr:nitrile hydratase subunit beta [Gammaproteobacteria bacterium]
MNGAHDLGGMHGFAAIDQAQIDQGNAGNFTSLWEEKVFAMTLACGMLGQWNLDQSRFARENTDPSNYLNSHYYEHWLHGLETLLLEKGVVSHEELKHGKKESLTCFSSIKKEDVAAIIKQGGPASLASEHEPFFQVGDKATVANFHPKSHTRAPRYIRGKNGVIVKHHGTHIFPDEHALSGTKIPVHLYNIRFESDELWGAGSDGSVFVDVFEPYLLASAAKLSAN